LGFLSPYKAVFNAVKTMLTYVPAVPYSPAVPAHDGIPEVPEVLAVPASGVASLKTVVLGEQFTLGDLPKAIINAEDTTFEQATFGSTLNTKINFSVILVIRDYKPQDWFIDIIPVMDDVIDAILADRTLRGTVMDCIPTKKFPGDITFDDKVLFGGIIRFSAELLYSP
jgi:hypothetical protein